jgi:mono/diheme cytochrome c family protein
MTCVIVLAARNTQTDWIDAMKKMLLLTATLVPVLLGTPSRAADVQANWTKHCASCHGKDGKGQTKAGKMAGVKDQTDPQYQAGLKDDKMFAAVKEGLKEGGKEKMKPFKDKLSDDEIKALITQVRALKK